MLRSLAVVVLYASVSRWLTLVFPQPVRNDPRNNTKQEHEATLIALRQRYRLPRTRIENCGRRRILRRNFKKAGAPENVE